MKKRVLIFIMIAVILSVGIGSGHISINNHIDMITRLVNPLMGENSQISQGGAAIIGALIGAVVLILTQFITMFFSQLQQAKATRIQTQFSIREQFKNQLREANTKFAGLIIPEMIYEEGIRNPNSNYPTELCNAAMALRSRMKPYSRFERVLHDLIEKLTQTSLRLFYSKDISLFNKLDYLRKKYDMLYAQYHYGFAEFLRAQHKGYKRFVRGISFEGYYNKVGKEMEEQGYEWEWPPITIKEPTLSRSIGVVKFYRQGEPITEGTLKISGETNKDVKSKSISIAENNKKMRDSRGKRAVAEWDMKDDKGNLVPVGTYRIDGKITTDKETEEFSLMVAILRPYKWEFIFKFFEKRINKIRDIKKDFYMWCLTDDK